MSSKTKKIALLALFASIAIIAGYIEFIVSAPIPIPYVKLGIGNVVIITALYLWGGGEAFLLLIVKVLSVAFLFTGFSGLMYSLSGGILSFFLMYLMKKTGKFSVIGISIVGGICHNIGQILMAAFIVGTIEISYFFAPLLITGGITGFIVGIISRLMLRSLEHVNISK